LLGAEALVPCRFDLVFQAFESFAKEAGFLGCKSHWVELARFTHEWKFELWNWKLEAGKYKEAPFRVIASTVIGEAISSLGKMQMAY
jgi:hypothetical protein